MKIGLDINWRRRPDARVIEEHWEHERVRTINIFDVIGETTRRIEPFHSEFLAEALRVSVTGDRSLFDAIWKLVVPEGWDIPLEPRIESEERLLDGKRVDICIFDKSRGRLVGIEVKTTKASAETGQLEAYLDGLCAKYGYDKNDEDRVAIAYITPFNRKRAGENADFFPAVKIFDEFARDFGNAVHISWLDIADIAWDGNELWKQHQAFVHQRIANYRTLRSFVSRDRSFDRFFSEGAVEDFWTALPIEGEGATDAGITINLKTVEPDPASLVRALEFLVVDEENVSAGSVKHDEFREESRQRFLDSKFRNIHRAIFDLPARHGHVWLAGKRDYGLRVAHCRHSGGVSLLRSKGEQRLLIGQPR